MGGYGLEFLFYFGDVFTPFNFMLLLIGTIGGLILGATPGLSPTMAVALLIPFTFKLDATQGLILLGAAYTSTVAGGAADVHGLLRTQSCFVVSEANARVRERRASFCRLPAFFGQRAHARIKLRTGAARARV